MTFEGDALPAAAARRSRQGAQADHRAVTRPHPDLPGRRRPEEPRAGRGDRRRLAGGLLRPRASPPSSSVSVAAGRSQGRPDPRRLRRGAHRPAGGRGRSRGPAPTRSGAYAALYVGGMGSREQNFYNAAGGPDGLRRGRGDRAGPVPVRPAAGRDGRGAVRVDRPDLAARATGRGSPNGCRLLADVGRDHLRAGALRRTQSRRSWTP